MSTLTQNTIQYKTKYNTEMYEYFQNVSICEQQVLYALHHLDHLFLVFFLLFVEVGGLRGRGWLCGVGENRGFGMPQTVSLLPILLALMGYGEAQ